MQAVQLVFILFLLRQQSLGQGQLVRKQRLSGRIARGVTLTVTYYPAQSLPPCLQPQGQALYGVEQGEVRNRFTSRRSRRYCFA